MIFKKSVFLLLLLQHSAFTYGITNPDHHNLSHHSLISDKAALLAFKKTIILDPKSILGNWVEAVHVCNFTGVTCDKLHHRVTKLQLVDTELAGLLSPSISDLTGLRVSRMWGNDLSGNIPLDFSSLQHLRSFVLEANRLHGSIPEFLAPLSKFTVFQIMDSNISGTIPISLFSNCPSLWNIDLSGNILTGNIPEEIRNCPRLWNLNLYNNQLTGQHPFSLSNLPLGNLGVENNLLHGELPTEIVRKLDNLLFLNLSCNNMASHDGNSNLDPFFNALAEFPLLRGL